MCEITIQVTCPHCQGSKVVKNGCKKDGTQNFLCKSCKRQFIHTYRNNGSNPIIKHLITSMLLRNTGIRDISTILKVSRKTVLNHLLFQGNLCKIVALKNHYHSVQVDEHWRSAARHMLVIKRKVNVG